MMATLAELTQQKPVYTDGISLLPELTSNHTAQLQHPYLYFEFPENGGQLAIRMGNWKGVKTDMRQHPENKWMLFNLDDDRNETTDLADQHPELIKKFETIVIKEHYNAHIKEWEFVNPKLKYKK